MADARPVELAKRVAAELAAAPFETKPTLIERVYLPNAELKETGLLKVMVAVAGWRMASDNRAEWEYQIQIDVGVLYRAADNIGAEATAAFDKASRLLEQIADMYRFQRTGTEKDFRIESVQFGGGGDQPYFQEHIAQFKQFTGVVSLTFVQLRGE